MLLRSITKHLKDQNWFAVALDFFIVVAGILIALQITNWNEERAFVKQEAELLIELKREIKVDIAATNSKIEMYALVTSSGRRAVNFIESGTSCGVSCWPVLVDFFHASQWQTIKVNRRVYDDMRRLGMPQSREIVDAMETYLAQNVYMADVIDDKPVYRSHVRSLMPLIVHDAYWAQCYVLTGAHETFIEDCPKGVADNVAARAVDAIVQDEDVLKYLTFWYSDVVSVPSILADQNVAAEKAILAINAELEKK